MARSVNLGDKVSTSSGGCLEAVTVYTEGTGRKTRLMVNYICETCHKDRELFPDVFTTRALSFKNGTALCGCCDKYFYSEGQAATLASRVCEDTDKVFLGFNGDYIGKNTKIITYCNLHKSFTKTTQLHSFLNGIVIGCTDCGIDVKSEKSSIPDEEIIQRAFSNGDYLEGTSFVNKQTHWELYCPVCSNDEYVQYGVCNGIFITDSWSMSNGRKSCRCGGNYHYSKYQMEYRLKKIMMLEERGDRFVGWESQYKNIVSTFLYICGKEHGEKKSNPSSYINGKSRCRECYNERVAYGYYPERKEEEDNLYLVELTTDHESFVKLGRAFNITARFRPYKKIFKITLLHKLKGDHESIFIKEQKLLKENREYKYKPEVRFAGETECFTHEVIQQIEGEFS